MAEFEVGDLRLEEERGGLNTEFTEIGHRVHGEMEPSRGLMSDWLFVCRWNCWLSDLGRKMISRWSSGPSISGR